MKRFKNFMKRLIELLTKKELSILPGQLAFFFVLSVVPILLLIFYLSTYFNLSFDVISDFIKESFSEGIIDIISPLLTNRAIDSKFVFFLIISFFIASGGSYSIIIASNTIFHSNSAGMLQRRIKSLILTIILILLFLFILVVPLFGQTILNLLSFLGVDNSIMKAFTMLLPVLKWPLTLFIIFFFIKVIYTIAPDDKIPSSYVNKGAIFTTVCWLLTTSVYSYYINNIARYDLFYGGLSNLVILMLWFYLMAYIFVVGLAMNFRNMEEEIAKTNALELEEIQKEEKKLKKGKKTNVNN